MNKINITQKFIGLFVIMLMIFSLVSCDGSKNTSNEVASEALNVNDSKEESSKMMKEASNNQSGFIPDGGGNNRPNGGGNIDKSDDEVL